MPSDKSEIVSQLLFGECAKFLERKSDTNWVKIQMQYDGYEGWVDSKQLTRISEIAYLDISSHCLHVDTGQALVNKVQINLLLGSQLPITKSVDDIDVISNSKTLMYGKEDLVNVAKLYLGTPYLWGGRSRVGIDCSGLTQQIYKICGGRLPRDAYQQADLGEGIQFDEKRPGDLAFFHNKEGKIIHVGIIIGRDCIIHAHGFVKTSILDKKGILVDNSLDYTHQLSYIKRYY